MKIFRKFRKLGPWFFARFLLAFGTYFFTVMIFMALVRAIILQVLVV